MKTKTNIFMTGVTGYIGGSVLARFLEHPNVSFFHITVLVRSSDKASKLKSIGVDAVVGSLTDLPLVEKLVYQADIILSMADADNFDSIKSMLKGLKAKHEETGVIPIFIHTSGTGVLADNAAGEYSTETVYNDTDVNQIESLPLTQLHREVDVAIVNADLQGYSKTYIVLPSTIYGIAKNKLVDLGIQNPHSLQIPHLIRASLGRGQGGMVGAGKNLWPDVSNDDIADLYIVLFNSIISNPETPHGREGFYFGENGEHSLYDIGKAISEVLVELGKGKDSKPTTFTKDEIDKYFDGSDYLGSNSRCRANRARSIGWNPIHTTEDMLKSIKPEVIALSG